MLDTSDPRIILAGLFGDAIMRMTTQHPMTIDQIVEALCYTAGHAMAQRAAIDTQPIKESRDSAIRALDRGIADAKAGNMGGLILPPH